ncbi:MAG: enolase C-terminal domain-like protein [Ruminococcus sp.]
MYREAVTVMYDLCIEIHRRCGISDAIALARGIEKYHPYFYEDPVKPDNFDDMGAGRAKKDSYSDWQTGERDFTLRRNSQMLIKRDAVQSEFVRT